MKKMIFGLIAACLVTGGSSVLLSNTTLSESKAVDPTYELYFRSSKNGYDTSTKLTQSGSIYTINNVSLSKGDEFKIATAGWEGDGTYVFSADSRVQNETAVFFGGSDKENIKCNATGIYNISADVSSYKVTITFTTTATYSYFLTSESVSLDKAYLFNTEGSDELYAKSSSPSLSSFNGGQAYDVKFGEDNYRLYKIDDRYLGSFSKLKLTDLSHDSVAYTISGKEKIYVNGTSVENSTTDIYLAAAFAYDVAGIRGKATYHEYNFMYSICAASQSAAEALVGRYAGLSDDAKLILGSSTMEVYDVSGTLGESTKKDVNFNVIANSLQTIAANKKDGLNVLPELSVESNGSALIIGAIGIGALLSIGGLFLLRKRKAE